MPVPKLSFKARLQTDPVTGKPALLFPEGVLLLSPSAGEILGLCDGVRSQEALVAILSERHAVAPAILEADVAECLEKLRAKGLVEMRPA
jgi:coenzyme PQQ biosynthesis protein PqqD